MKITARLKGDKVVIVKIKDEDLQELVKGVLNTLLKVGSYKVKVEDRFVLIKDAERVIKKAMEGYMLATVHHWMEKRLHRTLPKLWIRSEAMQFIMGKSGEKEKQENDQRKEKRA